MSRLQSLRWPALLALALFSTACPSKDDETDTDTGEDTDTETDTDTDTDTGPEVALQLQILHASDMEGSPEAAQDAPRFSAVVNGLRADYPDNTLILASGDNFIPGPLHSAAEDESLRPLLGVEGAGRGQIAMVGAIGVQASALGNHEFDAGPGVLASVIGPESVDDDGDGTPDRTYAGTTFPYLSVNVDVSGDADLGPLVVASGQDASSIPHSISSSTVIAVQGEAIGLVGLTTPALPSISSGGPDVVVSPADPDDLNAVAALVQAEVDALTSTGINKVIVLSHLQQFSREQQLATLLTDVDVVIAGGSGFLLADENDRLRPGDTADGDYPTWAVGSDGNPVAVLNTTGEYHYVGRLVIGFDEDGVVIENTVDAVESGIFATDEQGVTDLGNPPATPEVQALADAMAAVLAVRDSNTFGQTDVYLNGARGSVRTEETNLGNITADANLMAGQSHDPTTAISLKNAGGIRASIGRIYSPPGSNDPADLQYLPPEANPAVGKLEGEISQFDIETSLRFNNELSIVTATAAELVALLEHGVAATQPGDTPGQFGQVGGLRYSFDPSLAPGSRVRNVYVLDADGTAGAVSPDVVMQDGVLQGDPARTFRVVTLAFLADGGDGYPYPSTGREDLASVGLPAGIATFTDPGTEQDALAEYLEANYPTGSAYSVADTPIADDERVQNLAERSDTVIPAP